MFRKISLVLAIILLYINFLALTSCAAAPSYSLIELQEILNECEERKSNCHTMAEAARALGYPEENAIIVIAKAEWQRAEEERIYHQNLYDKLVEEERLRVWKAKEKEYPVACFIWKYFRDLGYNEYVVAGLLGNMMAEAGGQTLEIQYKIYSLNKKYYGICQWSMVYYKSIKNASLKEQCEFLANNIEEEFNMFAYTYKKEFTYEDFLNLEDAEEAALVFATVYERCSSVSYNQRQANALVAYDYF